MSRALVKTYWWNESPNFGDMLSPLLIERLFSRRAVWSDLPQAELTACGSLLQWITPTEAIRANPLAVWGSGFIFTSEPAPSHEKVNYFAIRGALSAEFAGLRNGETAVGDPGLLSSLIATKRTSQYSVGFVPHLWHRQDSDFLRLAKTISGSLMIDVTDPPEKVLAEISSCELVVSSSLHGLVVADSYAIPTIWVSAVPDSFGGRFKFDDYYSALGVRRDPIQLRNLRTLETLRASARLACDTSQLLQLQNGLLDSFPAELR